MTRLSWISTAWVISAILSVTGCAQKNATFIGEQKAIDAAFAEVGGELLGIRFDEPDKQWDVFVKAGDQAYEVEVNALNGKIVAVEEESLEEIQAELSGDLSHEGVEGDVD